MGRRNVGVWKGPGVLLLIHGEWRWYDPADMSREQILTLKQRATAIVGRDDPRISIIKIIDEAAIV